MTKHHEPDRETVRDRSAASNEKELLQNGIGFVGEGLTERLERVARRLMEIDERWDNRLVLNKIVLPEYYFSNRVTFVAKIRCAKINRSVYVACHFQALDEVAATKSDILHLRLNDLQDEHVVLVPIGQDVHCDDSLVSTIGKVSVTIYRVPKKDLRLTQGSTYRGIFDGAYHALPVVRDRHSLLFGLGPAFGPDKPHPCIIQRCPQVSDYIPDEAQDDWRDAFCQTDIDDMLSSLFIALHRGLGGSRFYFIGNERFEIVDQYLGPFDL